MCVRLKMLTLGFLCNKRQTLRPLRTTVGDVSMNPDFLGLRHQKTSHIYHLKSMHSS